MKRHHLTRILLPSLVLAAGLLLTAQATFQPVVNYNFEHGWAVSFAPLMSGDWSAPDGHQLTIPLGLGFSRVTVVGRQPIELGAEYYRNVARPRGVGTDHLLLQVSLLFPAAS